MNYALILKLSLYALLMDGTHDLSHERLGKSQSLTQLGALFHDLVMSAQLHHHHVVRFLIFPDLL